ncbi:MAG TPA: serpin family protein [Dermatophilaceae bacterium]|nr:serpin family protein [Dermatophilaceae bacterium]
MSTIHSTPASRRSVPRAALLGTAGLPLLGACQGGASGVGGGGDGSADGGGTVARSAVARTRPPADALAPGVVALSGFADRVTARLLADGDGDLVCSPYSIAVALAMTVNGAAGSTKAEMLSVLGGLGLAELDAGMSAITALVESRSGTRKGGDGKDAEVVVAPANSIWAQRDVPWKPAFLDALARWYAAGVHLVDYQTGGERARTEINAWTADRTRQKITELVPSGVITPATRMVLVNAIYLSAPWLTPFDPGSTRPQPFHAPSGTISVPTMWAELRGGTAAARRPGWQAVSLPLAGGELAMTVVLPARSDAAGFAALLDPAKGGGIGAILGSLRAEPTVILTMPTWTSRTQVRLRPLLSVLGMPTAFADSADFSGMTDAIRLAISEVVHQGFVAVREGGVEAAAATAVIMREVSAPLDPFTLTLDRPFLYVIHDVASAAPLFVGRVSIPKAP